MATVCQAGPQRPAGRRMPIAASGTKTPSSTTSCEPVPRRPSARQVSLTSRPGVSNGSAKCSTVGPASGSSWIAIVMNRSPAGAPLAKTFRPVTRYPPGTFSARPDPASQSEPPLVTRIACSAATRRSRGSTGAAS